MTDILESLAGAKEMMDALPKPKFEAAVCNHQFFQMLGEALPPASEGLLHLGVRIYPLEGLDSDQALMFPTHAGALAFLDGVAKWRSVGMGARKACQITLDIFQNILKE